MPQAASCVAFCCCSFFFCLLLVLLQMAQSCFYYSLSWWVVLVPCGCKLQQARNRFGQWEPLLAGSEVFEPQLRIVEQWSVLPFAQICVGKTKRQLGAKHKPLGLRKNKEEKNWKEKERESSWVFFTCFLGAHISHIFPIIPISYPPSQESGLLLSRGCVFWCPKGFPEDVIHCRAVAKPQIHLQGGDSKQ